MVTEENIKRFSEQCKNIIAQIDRDVIGQNEVIEGAVIAMIAGGNVLLEGVPGVGKTRLVRSLGRVFDLPFSRIQFTPDLMPADVTGTNIIVKDEHGNSTFEFQKGPIFSNIILADEINRATPKTQSALLEAMQEHTVTVMGVSRKLEEPFFVLATQNPVEQDGTYPLPEAQMDRFMFKIIVKNPSLDELMEIVNMTQVTMAEVADAACNGEQLLEMRATANAILVATDVMKALMNGRQNVSYADINELAYPVLRHRMKLTFEAIAERVTPDEIVTMIIDELAGKRPAAAPATPVTPAATATTPAAPEETPDVAEGKATKKKKLFGRN